MRPVQSKDRMRTALAAIAGAIVIILLLFKSLTNPLDSLISGAMFKNLSVPYLRNYPHIDFNHKYANSLGGKSYKATILANETEYPVKPYSLVLKITEPPEEHITSRSSITIVGVTSPSAWLWVNGKLVFPDEDGRFVANVDLPVSLNLIEIWAEDLFGQKKSKTLMVWRKIHGPDVNKDGVVNVHDLISVALAFNSMPGHPNWNEDADINKDGKVDILDLVLVGVNYGQ